MQADGNVVIYDKDNHDIWSSRSLYAYCLQWKKAAV
jgi:hypothetical protein